MVLVSFHQLQIRKHFIFVIHHKITHVLPNIMNSILFMEIHNSGSKLTVISFIRLLGTIIDRIILIIIKICKYFVENKQKKHKFNVMKFIRSYLKEKIENVIVKNKHIINYQYSKANTNFFFVIKIFY